MASTIIIDDGEIISATDYEKKAEEIKNRLDEDLFLSIDEDKTYDISYDKFGNKIKRKRTIKRNEVLPILTPIQVNSKLNEYLRIYKPLSSTEAQSIDDKEYLDALKHYMGLISYINQYVVFLPSKQTFCSFANITTPIYNDLLASAKYEQVFSSIEDYLIDANFTSAQSGLVDSKTIQNRLQTRNAGHNLIKNVDSITFIQNNNCSREEIDSKLKMFENMTKRIADKK